MFQGKIAFSREYKLMNWYKHTILAAVKWDRKLKREVVIDDNALDNEVERQWRGTPTPTPRYDRGEYGFSGRPPLTIRQLFYNYVIPVAKQAYPNFPVEHYSLEAFQNMSREDTGLDNRRRDRDSVFLKAGTEIKALTNKCLQDFGSPSFKPSVRSLVDRLYKWYFEESPSGTVVERPKTRQIDYKKLHDIGVTLTPVQGKRLSRQQQPTERRQRIRDEFMAAHNALDQGDDTAMIEWWLNYEGDINSPNIPTSAPKQRPVPLPEPEEFDEIYDWKTDTFHKEPKQKAA